MIHTGTLTKSPAMTAQHKAKQERAARFAQAASRLEDKTRAAADIAQAKALERYMAALPKPEPLAEPPPPAPQDSTFPLKIVTIQGAVANEYNLPRQVLIGPNKRANYVLPRQIAMYLSRKLTRLSLPRIGRQFNRDHTTLVHGCNKVSELIKCDPKLEAVVKKLEAELTELGAVRTGS